MQLSKGLVVSIALHGAIIAAVAGSWFLSGGAEEPETISTPGDGASADQTAAAASQPMAPLLPDLAAQGVEARPAVAPGQGAAAVPTPTPDAGRDPVSALRASPRHRLLRLLWRPNPSRRSPQRLSLLRPRGLSLPHLCAQPRHCRLQRHLLWLPRPLPQTRCRCWTTPRR